MGRTFTLTLATLVAIAASPAHGQTPDLPRDTEKVSQDESAFTVSGGVTLASQYRFRGISLSDKKVAVQGTVNLNHTSGLYTGVWASSLDGFGELGGSNVEVDLYAGFKTDVGDGVMLDAGLLYYAYPGSTGGDFEFFEPYANVSGTMGPVTAKAGVAFAPSQKALGNNSNIYVFGDVSSAIPTTPITIKGHIGYSKGNTFGTLCRLVAGGRLSLAEPDVRDRLCRYRSQYRRSGAGRGYQANR